MSPVDCPRNKSTSCCIPASDSGFKGVWQCIASHQCFKNSEGVSQGPICLIAYRVDQFISLGIALTPSLSSLDNPLVFPYFHYYYDSNVDFEEERDLSFSSVLFYKHFLLNSQLLLKSIAFLSPLSHLQQQL